MARKKRRPNSVTQKSHRKKAYTALVNPHRWRQRGLAGVLSAAFRPTRRDGDAR